MSERQMICYEEDGKRFQMRAAGIALRDGHVLVHKATYERFWSLPGGRVERFESGAETLAREMVEELEQVVTVKRLVFVLESFFELLGRRFHEIGFYYEMQVPEAFPFNAEGVVCHRIRDGEADLEFMWVKADRAGLDAVAFAPAALRDRLLALPEAVTHCIDREAAPMPAVDIGILP